MEKILVMTVGLPRSGKSTWARSQGFPIVNPDSIRLALHGQRFAAEAEPFVWAIAKVMVKALFDAGHDTVIVDATNTTRKRRDEWKSSKWERRFKLCWVEPAVCRERAIATERPDLFPIIDSMAAGFEPLEMDELNWDGRPKPTIAELEALLASEDKRDITILPSGEIRAN